MLLKHESKFFLLAKSGDLGSDSRLEFRVFNLFNQFVGESPINYLMHLRARKVAEHLRSGTYTLKQIADMTGFNGVSYMSETFRKFFEKSPREYRKDWDGR